MGWRRAGYLRSGGFRFCQDILEVFQISQDILKLKFGIYILFLFLFLLLMEARWFIHCCGSAGAWHSAPSS